MSTCASVTELNASRPCQSHAWQFIGPGGLCRFVMAVLLTVATILIGVGPAQADPPQNGCHAGTFCAWPDENYRGQPHLTDVQTTSLGKCVSLPEGLEAKSFINQTGRPVTVYQDATCSSEADFHTYPTGSFVPKAPYVARAITIWSH